MQDIWPATPRGVWTHRLRPTAAAGHTCNPTRGRLRRVDRSKAWPRTTEASWDVTAEVTRGCYLLAEHRVKVAGVGHFPPSLPLGFTDKLVCTHACQGEATHRETPTDISEEDLFKLCPATPISARPTQTPLPISVPLFLGLRLKLKPHLCLAQWLSLIFLTFCLCPWPYFLPVLVCQVPS